MRSSLFYMRPCLTFEYVAGRRLQEVWSCRQRFCEPDAEEVAFGQEDEVDPKCLLC